MNTYGISKLFLKLIFIVSKIFYKQLFSHLVGKLFHEKCSFAILDGCAILNRLDNKHCKALDARHTRPIRRAQFGRQQLKFYPVVSLS